MRRRSHRGCMLAAGGDFTHAGSETCNFVAQWRAANGACCFADGSCGVRGEEECSSHGGYFVGLDTSCTHGLCPQPEACCLASGSCSMLMPADCASGGGVPGGPASTCTPNPCACTGDMNCDGLVDFRDINRFVLYLSDFDAWRAAHPDCNPLNGDINADGEYGQGSFRDINPFVSLLAAGGGVCE